jgi:iron complex transport system substrate-binding protein
VKSRARSNPLTRLQVLLAAALASTALVACGASDTAVSSGTTAPADETAAADTDAETTATDETAATDEADPAPADGPQRIVSLSPTATEMLFAIGAGDQVIAVDSLSNYPAEAPVTDLSAFEPNLEAIAAEDPDLVVLSFDPGDIVSGLEDAGIPTILQGPAATLDDVYAQIADLGVATGQIDGAADVVAEMRTAIDEIVAATPVGDEPIRIYHEVDGTFYAASSNSFIGQLYGLLGVTNIADEADTDGFGYPQLSPEYILEADPQLIVIPELAGYTAAEVTARPGWDIISAVQNDAVLVVNDDIASRWGPRIPEFLSIVSEALVAQQVGA